MGLPDGLNPLALASGLSPVTSSSSPEEASSPSQSSEETTSLNPSSESEPVRQSGFLAATFEELKLVVWPSRQQLFSESVAVILMVSLSAASIAAVSRFYGWGASQIFR